jgi:hypothetical protein
MTTTQTADQFRTLYGSHRHASWTCANTQRRVTSGDVITCTTDDELALPPCSLCQTTEAVAAAPAPAAKAYCAGSGQTPANSRRLYIQCPVCNKTLKGQSGGVRKHQP